MATTGGDSGARARRVKAAAQLGRDISTLRSAMNDMLARYALRVGGRLEELAQSLAGDGTLDQPPRLPTLRQLAAAQRILEGHGVKPKKARAKDFARLEELTAGLLDVFDE